MRSHEFSLRTHTPLIPGIVMSKRIMSGLYPFLRALIAASPELQAYTPNPLLLNFKLYISSKSFSSSMRRTFVWTSVGISESENIFNSLRQSIRFDMQNRSQFLFRWSHPVYFRNYDLQEPLRFRHRSWVFARELLRSSF